MSSTADKFRGGAAFQSSSFSMSSKDWAGVADSAEKAEKAMDLVTVGATYVAARGSVPAAQVAVASTVTGYIAKQMKEYAQEKAEEAKRREQEFEAVKERVTKAQWERAMRDISERGPGIRDRVLSGERLRDYRDPPTREVQERSRRTV